jgi:hypothetical protein
MVCSAPPEPMADDDPPRHDGATDEIRTGRDPSPEVTEALEALLVLAATLEELDLEGVEPAFLR